MTEKTIKTTTCNRCNSEINTDTEHVNAGSYGAHFHLSCFDKMTAIELAVDLGLDEIKTIVGENWQAAEKLIYTRRGKNALIRPEAPNS